MSVAESLSSAAPNIPTGEELVARARALAPRLRERAVACERDRNIPRESVEEYIDAGLMRTIMPKRWGGYEHDHEVAFDIAIELGKLDLRLVGLVPELSQRPRRHPGAFPRRGAARRLEQQPATPASPPRPRPPARPRSRPAAIGSTASGRGASGIRHSQWIMIGGLVHREHEHHPDMRLFLVPVVGGQAARHLVLRRPARHRLEHGRRSTTCSCPSTAACRSHAARRLLAGLADQHRTDLPHAVHRGSHLCAARSRRSGSPAAAMPTSCNGRASAISPIRAQHRPARAGADRASPRSRRRSTPPSCWRGAASRPRARTMPA